MLCDIHQQLCLLEMLDPETIAHLLHSLLRKGRDIPPQHQNCIRNALILHAIGQDFDGFHSNLFVFWEEDEELIRFVIRFFLC